MGRHHNPYQKLQAQLSDAAIIDVVLDFSLQGDCPACGESIDMMESEAAPTVRAMAKSGNLKALNNMVFGCPACGQDLQLDVVI